MTDTIWTPKNIYVATMGGSTLKGVESVKCMSFRAEGQAATALQHKPRDSTGTAQGTTSCVLGMHKHTRLSNLISTKP